jgi:hydroxymethylbilane synthase
LSGDIDIAVHSLKDIPSDIPSGLHIAAVPERHNPYDAFVSAGFKLLESPDGARIGTSSVRREVQLKNLLRRVEVVPLRGNIDTRLRKVKEGIIDAAVVAYAGLERMGWEDEAVEVISDDIMLPAAGQGAVAVEVRDDFKYQQIIEAINDHKTIIETGAERTFIKQISGGCNVPVGVIARLSEGLIRIKGGIFGMFGRESVCVKKEAQGNPEDSVKIAEKLAEGILEAGGLEILRRIRAQAIP